MSGEAGDADWEKGPEPIRTRRVLCSRAECDRGRHSFRTRMRGRAPRGENATCRSETCAACGRKAVDRGRLDRREPGDMPCFPRACAALLQADAAPHPPPARLAPRPAPFSSAQTSDRTAPRAASHSARHAVDADEARNRYLVRLNE